jgi:hypothetical protein
MTLDWLRQACRDMPDHSLYKHMTVSAFDDTTGMCIPFQSCGYFRNFYRPVLARINEKVDRVSAILMPFILAIVGIALVVDATSYLATGEGLF